jgi:hypothetical protein
VGNRYEGAFEIADFVQDTCATNARIRWLGIVDDATLHRLYSESTFTVYPSVMEGFGLPIVESLWHGRPCVCSNEGVMAEIAADGGCVTTDVSDERTLAETIYKVATDHDLLSKLSREAIERRTRSWDDYASDLMSMLISQEPSSKNQEPSIKDSSIYPVWQDVLYGKCLIDNWQMADSERLAMTGLLARHKPRCSIEVGTYCGGSLSLISQYSEVVFSIDIDPAVADTFKYFANVSFLTGQSGDILPLLFQALDEAAMPVDFILLDGEHSAEGVRRDIGCVLNYVPKKPLFVVIHDSFNPECRRGILEASWGKSPYAAWLDVDFVPGRIVENGGLFDGQLWGGLALAYFLPVRRQGQFVPTCSAQSMFKIVSQR